MTGDSPERAERLGADGLLAGMSPDQKKAEVERLKQQGSAVLFVGDGLNDAPALAAADASLAISTGAPLAAAVAHAVLPAGRLASIPRAIDIALRADRVIRSNIGIAIAYNALGIGVAGAGLLHPALAALIMVASSLIVSARSLSIAERPNAGDRPLTRRAPTPRPPRSRGFPRSGARAAPTSPSSLSSRAGSPRMRETPAA